MKTLALVCAVLALACNRDLGVPDGYCEKDCKEQWTPSCEERCGTPQPAGSGGDAGNTGGSSGTTAGAGGDGGSGAGGNAGGNGGTAGNGLGDGGIDGGGSDAGDGGDDCEQSNSPLEEPCVIDDELAVFVAPDGEPDADGTMADPIAIEAAVEKALERGVERILLCNGSYDEALVIDAAESALEVYGGFDCEVRPWAPSSSGGSTVAPDSGEALRIKDAEERVRIENVAFVAADAEDDGESSIAAIVNDSADVELVEVTLTAGKGADGANAEETEQFEFPETSACADEDECLEGIDAVGTAQGLRREYECPAGDETYGGAGGPGGISPGAGENGFPDLDLGVGGDPEDGVDPCGTGQVGDDGDDGDDGAGAQTRGTIASETWQPAGGENGNHGMVGQGGGGGGGTDTNGGGGGGAGGCGGKAGDGGGGGGGSIALLSIDSALTLESCRLEVDDGGDGGDGADGLAGMASGGGGGVSTCGGGTGGAGGDGGHGGGGAGGISVGVLYTGTKPSRTDSPIETGSPGLAGQGAGTDNDGIAGIADNELEID